MRAPSINPKKCTVVRVEGSNGSTDKDEHSFLIVRGEEVDTTENELLEQSKEAENPECQLEETHAPKDFVAIPDIVLVQCLQVQQNFQETLKEIDLGLAKYDGDVGKEIHLGAEEGLGSPLSASEGILKAGAGECNFIIDENNHVFSVQEMSASLGGPIRGWKHLARENAASEQVGSSLPTKRGVQENLEVSEDLVPTKRRCASVKSFKTVEVGVLPRRGQ